MCRLEGTACLNYRGEPADGAVAARQRQGGGGGLCAGGSPRSGLAAPRSPPRLGPVSVSLVSAEGTLLLTMEEALSRAGEKPKQIGKVSSATYLNKLFIGYV